MRSLPGARWDQQEEVPGWLCHLWVWSLEEGPGEGREAGARQQSLNRPRQCARHQIPW